MENCFCVDHFIFCWNIQGCSDRKIISLLNREHIRTGKKHVIVWKSVYFREGQLVKYLTDLYIAGQCQIYSFFGNSKMERSWIFYTWTFNLKETVCGFVPFSAHQHSATLQDRGKIQKHKKKIKGGWELKKDKWLCRQCSIMKIKSVLGNAQLPTMANPRQCFK